MARLTALIDDPTIAIEAGAAGQRALATLDEADTVVAAVVGYAGLVGTLAAAEAGKRIALANKESLVAGGELVMKTLAQSGGEIIDRLGARRHPSVPEWRAARLIHQLWLTASGGRRGADRNAGSHHVDEALDHPNWSMGPKITIDSATLMNKGLELIEATWLFDCPPDQVQIAVHPPSLVHSMVEFVDGTFKAQLSGARYALGDRRGIAIASSAAARSRRRPVLEPARSGAWN